MMRHATCGRTTAPRFFQPGFIQRTQFFKGISVSVHLSAWHLLTSSITAPANNGERSMSTNAVGSPDRPNTLSMELSQPGRRIHELRCRWPNSVQFYRCHSSTTVQGQAKPTNYSTAPKKVVKYSPLHHNVEDFCKKIMPSHEEVQAKKRVIDIIRAQAKQVFSSTPDVEVEVFGSFASGLSTWSSDVDLVVTGIMEQSKQTGAYAVSERSRVAARLRKLGEALKRNRRLNHPRITLIPRARIPIVKVKIEDVAVDISLGDRAGVQSARFLAQQARLYPSMAPLVLVLKTFLKSKNLNDASTGGLSSYLLCNMVVAHLQEEIKMGRDVRDLGEALYAFLLRYGEEFNYDRDVVSVASGGIVSQESIGMDEDSGALQSTPFWMGANGDSSRRRLMVECPLSGRNVSKGFGRLDEVCASFQMASRRLEKLAQGRKITDTNFNYLQALFNVSLVTKRSSPEDKKMQGMDEEEEIELGSTSEDGEEGGSDTATTTSTDDHRHEQGSSSRRRRRRPSRGDES